jgi:hemolysin D
MRVHLRRQNGDDERAFLPAALEVMETPPNPLGRKTALALCLVAFAALAWAWFGKVDIVAVANGKFISRTRTQVVQPFETGSVKTVLVNPGQEVRAGDPLIELDKTAVLAEKERARSDLAAALLDQMRLNALLDGASSTLFETIPDTSPAQRQRAQAQLTAQIASENSRLASLAKEKFQRLAERQVLQQTAAKLEKTLPLIAQRADIRTKAADYGASIPAKLESQQLLIEAQSERDITQSKIASVDAAIDEIDQKMLATKAEVRTNALSELSKAQDRLRAGEEGLAKATRRADLLTLRAPISGTVQQMHIAGIGAVVTPAQQLLSVVPQDETVKVEAVLENRDVGFVWAGQHVELKVDAFPFTRYGLLAGTVISVDRDAEATPVNASGAHGSVRAADEIDHVEASERLRYTVHIALEPGTLDIDGRPAKLLPGMSVRAEILTGKRRIIDFILAPLNEHIHDAMRER